MDGWSVALRRHGKDANYFGVGTSTTNVAPEEAQ